MDKRTDFMKKRAHAGYVKKTGPGDVKKIQIICFF